MTIGEEIRDEKLQHAINRNTAKIVALWSGKIDKYEYDTGEKILPSDQTRMIDPTLCTYTDSGKTLEKQIITTGDKGRKQVEALILLKLDVQQLSIKDEI